MQFIVFSGLPYDRRSTMSTSAESQELVPPGRLPTIQSHRWGSVTYSSYYENGREEPWAGWCGARVHCWSGRWGWRSSGIPYRLRGLGPPVEKWLVINDPMGGVRGNSRTWNFQDRGCGVRWRPGCAALVAKNRGANGWMGG